MNRRTGMCTMNLIHLEIPFPQLTDIYDEEKVPYRLERKT